MSDLNGAYHGPAIPPTKSFYSHGRSKAGRGCGSGSGRGCCCILALILKIVVSILVLLGLALLILWLIFRPVNAIEFHVTDARLTNFTLTNTNTLHYDLSLNITIRNPNQKIGVFYDQIEARLLYEDQRLASRALGAFYQGHKNTTVISAAFSGEKVVMLGEDVEEFNEERVSGFYSVDVKLYMRVRFRLGRVRIGKFKPRVGCDLKVPIQGTAVAGGGFQATKCDFDL